MIAAFPRRSKSETRTPAFSSTRRGHRVTAVASLVVTGLIGALPACSSGGSSPKPSKASGAAVRRQAGAELVLVQQGLTFIAEKLVTGAIGAVGAQGFTLLATTLTGPDATTQSLARIETQLKDINNQLTQVQTTVDSISSELKNTAFSDAMLVLTTHQNTVKALYTDSYKPLADAAKKLADFKANNPGADATTLEKAVADKKDGFVASYQGSNFAAIRLNQHSRLVPSSDVHSIMELAGRVMLDKGYLTSLDSVQLRDLYLAVSEQEAFATLMSLEYDLMVGNQSVYDATLQDYQAGHKVEVDNLPPLIPYGDIVAAPGKSVANTQIFRAPTKDSTGVGYPDTPWLPINPEGGQLGGDAVMPVVSANPGWDLPTDAQLQMLYTATANAGTFPDGAAPNTQPANSRLFFIYYLPLQRDPTAEQKQLQDKALLTSGRWNHDWFWSKDRSPSNPMRCFEGSIDGANQAVQRTYTLHHAGDMRKATAIGLQAQPGRIADRLNDPYSEDGSNTGTCDDYLIYLYNNATYAAGVILTRPSKADYAAQTMKPAAISGV